MLHTAHLNIGSNIGHRHGQIARAVALLSGLHEGAGTPRVSRPVESEPWGFESANRFVNVGMTICTSLSPAALLEATQAVEAKVAAAPHRHPDGTYADRLIDVDIIFYDDLVIDTPTLTLPHPRAHLREFVLLPLAELHGSWRHPLLGLTPAGLISRLH